MSFWEFFWWFVILQTNPPGNMHFHAIWIPPQPVE
jgi:hypothetical protein